MKYPEFDVTKTQQAIILIGVIALISLCTIFSQSAFMHLSYEANNGTPTAATNQSAYNQYVETYKFIYVIGIILIIAAIIIAFLIIKKTATT